MEKNFLGYHSSIEVLFDEFELVKKYAWNETTIRNIKLTLTN